MPRPPAEAGQALGQPGHLAGRRAAQAEPAALVVAEAGRRRGVEGAHGGLEIRKVATLAELLRRSGARDGGRPGEQVAAFNQRRHAAGKPHAVVLFGLDEEAGEAGMEREAGHRAANGCQALAGGHRAEALEQVERALQGGGFGGFDPRESAHVVDPHGEEFQQDARWIEAADFGGRLGRAGRVVACRPQPQAQPGGGATGASGALVGGRPRDGLHGERVQPAHRIVVGETRQPAVDHDADAVDGEGGFGHVGGDDDLAPGTGGQGLVLPLGREFAVEGKDRPPSGPPLRSQRLHRPADLMDAGHEDQGVALGTACHRLAQHRHGPVPQRLAPHGVAGLLHLDRKHPAVRANVLRPRETRIQGQAFQRRRNHIQLEVRAQRGLQPAAQRQPDIPVDMALVELVENHRRDAAQARVPEQAPHQHTLGQVTNACILRDGAFEPDLVPDLAADAPPSFPSDAAGQHAGRHATGLEHDDLAGEPAVVTEDLRQARGLAGPGRGLQHDPHPARPAGEVRQTLGQGVDGQVRSGHSATKARRPPDRKGLAPGK